MREGFHQHSTCEVNSLRAAQPVETQSGCQIDSERLDTCIQCLQQQRKLLLQLILQLQQSVLL